MHDLIPTTEDKMPLTELRSEASVALLSMQGTIDMYDTHNSDAQDVMVINTEWTPSRKLRQVAAELQKRQAALVEAGSKVRIKRAKVAQLREQIAECDDDTKAEILLATAEKMEAEIMLTERPYRGALSAVLRLKRLHDEVYATLQKKYGTVTSDVLDKEEARYWIKRIFAHALRDLRGMGRIHDGRQSVLFRMGFDSGAVQRMLVAWLEDRAQDTHNVSSEAEEKFLEQCADKFEEIVRPRLEHVENDQ